MRKTPYYIIILFVAAISFRCQKELSSPSTPPVSAAAHDPFTGNLQGNIFDETGAPASGVKITVGTKTTTTDARGYFRINNASLDKYSSVVTAEKAGYFKAIRNFNGTSGANQVMIKMIKKNSAGTITASTGGDVSMSNGVKIVLPANAVVNAQTGAAYTGAVTVYASYIDPTAQDIDQRVPGSFRAIDKDNKSVVLTSYGMMAVELLSASGEKLQIATGKSATLTTPIPASALTSAPATISLWYLDETTGIWKEEGQSTKTGSVYTGEVKHFSYWNNDIGGPTVNFTATFTNSSGAPLAYASVQIQLASGGSPYSAHGITDSLGQVSGPIPINSALILKVYPLTGTCGSSPSYTQNIGPYSANVNLGTIAIPLNDPAVHTISGKLLNCSGAPVTHGYAIVRYWYMQWYAAVNSSGDFSVSFLRCPNNPPSTCEVLGTDTDAQQQGTSVSFPITSTSTVVGNLIACGTSILEYINFNLDGTSHNLSTTNNPPDSIQASSFGFTGGLYNRRSYFDGAKTTGGGSSIHFNFDHNENTGAYPLTGFNVNNLHSIREEAPITVDLTRYPSVVGDFFEGTWSGQFKDSSDLTQTHTISCSFRARRDF